MGTIRPEAQRHFTQRPDDLVIVKPFLIGFDLTYADVASRGATQVAYLLKPRWVDRRNARP